MPKTKQKKINNLGICSLNNHHDSNKKYICLDKTCQKSEPLCQFCVLELHSDHRIISFRPFAEKVPQIYSEALTQLSLLIKGFKSQQLCCNEIVDRCQYLMDFLKKIEEKTLMKKKLIEKELSNLEFSYEEMVYFNKDFFTTFYELGISNEQEKYSKISNQINEIRKHLIIDGNSEIKVQSYEIISEDNFNENLLKKISNTLMEFKFAFEQDFDSEIPQIITTYTNFHLTPLQKFELKKNYIIKNLIQLPNSYIVASGHDNFLRYFKFIPNQTNPVSIKTLEGHNAWIRSLAYDGEFLASGSDDSALKIWRLNSANILEQVHLVHSSETNKAYFWSLTFIKKGMIAAGRGQNDNFSIRLWDYEGFTKQRVLFGHRNIVRNLKVLKNEVSLISVSDDASMKIWDLENFNLKKTIYAHKKQINCMAYNEKLGLLATAGSDFLIKIWKIEGFYNCLRSFFCSGVFDKILVLESFDKFGLLISGSQSGILKLWNWIDGSTKFTVWIGMEIHSLLCNENENLIFTGDASGKICVWMLMNV